MALEKSLNLVTLRVAAYVGMSAVADTAITFHMVDSMPRVLPAALGSDRHDADARGGCVCIDRCRRARSGAEHTAR